MTDTPLVAQSKDPPHVEILKEWDHGIYDPLLPGVMLDPLPPEYDEDPDNSHEMNLFSPCKRIVYTWATAENAQACVSSVVNAEHMVEGVLKKAIVKIDHSVLDFEQRCKRFCHHNCIDRNRSGEDENDDSFSDSGVLVEDTHPEKLE